MIILEYFCSMKRAAIIAIFISLAIGVAVGAWDIMHPLMPEESGAEYTDPAMWNSARYAGEFWSYALTWGGLLAIVTALISYLPVWGVLLAIGKIASSSRKSPATH